ncbi:MAG: DUF2318 domain-containing protein [Desulfobacterales bacterium]|nr:MAG: DUF2318 domain-containing protein [Desulfobacterales bacterium]
MSKKNSKKTPVKKIVKTSVAQPTEKMRDKREAKKAAVLGQEKKGRMPLFLGIACAALLFGGAFWLVNLNASKSTPVGASTTTAVSATVVTLPASLFEDGQARHFEHVDGKFTIKYFVLKSSDGVIRAAFDACDVCWLAGKGYYQDGDDMVCRNCGRRFASVLVNEVKGGCNPAPLNRKVENGNVIIQVQDILEGKTYFDFPGKV